MNHDFLLEQRANDESWKDVIIRTMARVVRGTSTKTLRIITNFSYYLRSSLSNKFPDIDSSKKHSFDYSFTRALPSRESFRIGRPSHGNKFSTENLPPLFTTTEIWLSFNPQKPKKKKKETRIFLRNETQFALIPSQLRDPRLIDPCTRDEYYRW